MKRNQFWNRQILRSAEGEGAGGAAPTGAEGGSPAPDNTGRQLSAFEQRLDNMSKQLGDFMSSQKQDKTKSEIAGYDSQLTSALREKETAVSTAEKALADAYDSGEGAAVARAQRELNEAINAKDTAKRTLDTFRTKARELERRDGGSQGNPGNAQQSGGSDDPTNLNAWKSKHASWYGVDNEMTKAAHAVDQRIRTAGVLAVGSKEYFNAIDREMKSQFPDKFGGTPPTSGGGGGNQNHGSGYQGRVPSSVLQGWQRMGIDTSNPETVKRMLSNRQKAVDKGILSAEPVQGSIVTR